MESKFSEILQQHTDKEDLRFEQLVMDINTIKNNHLFHIEKDIASIHVKMATVGADISWIRWGVVLVIGGLVTGAIALIFKG